MPSRNDPEHIAISKSGGITIDWRDGHRSEYSLKRLRDECPCANCTGAHGPPATNPRSPQPASPFPLYRPALKMDKVETVGNYAIRIGWNDGHDSGIYSYDYLRRICPCDECQSKRS